MRLATTRARLGHMIKACENLPMVAAELERAEGGTFPSHRVEVDDVPYIALVYARTAMIDRVYTSRKTLRRDLSKAQVFALKDLATAVNVEARHPALRGVGMVGHHAQVLHVWECRVGDSNLYDPFPKPTERMVVLAPVWHIDETNAGMKVTLWSASGGHAPSGDRLADPNLHYRFLLD